MSDTPKQSDSIEDMARRYSSIHRIGRAVLDEPVLVKAMGAMAGMLADNLNYDYVSVLLLDRDLEELEVVASSGQGNLSGLRIPVSRGATGYAARHSEVVNIPDVKMDPRYVPGYNKTRSELAVPVMNRDVVLGIINLESPVANRFDARDAELVSVLGDYASMAIVAAKTKQDYYSERAARQRLDMEVKLLSRVSKSLAAVNTLAALRAEALRLASEIMGWGDSVVWTIESESGQLLAAETRGRPGVEVGTRLRMGEGAPGKAAVSNEQVNTPGGGKVSEDTKGSSNRPQMAASIWDGREIAGVLHIFGRDADFSQSDLALLTVLAGQISTAFTAIRQKSDTLRQIAVLDDRTRRLDLLNRVTRSLTARMRIEDLLDELLRLCAEAFDLDHCALLLLDKSRTNLTLKAAIGYDDGAPRILALHEGITGHVATTGVPVLVADVTKDPRHIVGVSGGRSEMAVPLQVFGDIIGVLDVESVEESAFNEEDLDLITCFAAQAAVAIRNAEMTEEPATGKGC